MRMSQGVAVSENTKEYLPRLVCPKTVKKSSKQFATKYMDVTATFDIETTNSDTDGFVYSWQTCIGVECKVVRYFFDLAEILDILVD